jgi:hypothetical protein
MAVVVEKAKSKAGEDQGPGMLAIKPKAISSERRPSGSRRQHDSGRGVEGRFQDSRPKGYQSRTHHEPHACNNRHPFLCCVDLCNAVTVTGFCLQLVMTQHPELTHGFGLREHERTSPAR